MAQQDPGQPATETSYSDPIYDRLESLSQGLSRRWPLVLTFFILAVACGLLLQQQHQSTPEAASATRFIKASSDKAELQAFLDNEGEIPEFRGRAAMELAQYAIEDGDGAAAKAFAERGLSLIGKEQAELETSLRLSEAAGLRAAGDYEAALRLLGDIERGASAFPAHKMQAAISQAEILYQQAQAEGLDDAGRTALLQEALAILEPLQFGSDPARMQLRRVASYLFYRIRYENPSLKAPSEELMDEPLVDDVSAEDADAAAPDAQPDEAVE